MNLKIIKSDARGTCPCCGEPVYDPHEHLAREIFEMIPESDISAQEAQALYDKIAKRCCDHFDMMVSAVLDDDFERESFVSHSVN